MKLPLLYCLAALAFFSVDAHAATLQLTDASVVVVNPGQHADGYAFPEGLLQASDPIVSLRLDYDAATGAVSPTDHAMTDVRLLFDPAMVASLNVITSTPRFYRVIVNFTAPGVTEVVYPNPLESRFALISVHENFNGLTNLVWEATYASGNKISIVEGIIPEPSIAALMGMGVCGLLQRRRKH